MTILDPTAGKSKPLTLRAIFILMAFKILLSTGLFIGFKYFGLQIGSVSGDAAANLIGLTTLGYVLTFAVMIASILNRVMLGLRAAIAVDFLISIPAKAFIGFAIALIAMGLSLTPTVRQYFAYRAA